jgi:hypothetical protein
MGDNERMTRRSPITRLRVVDRAARRALGVFLARWIGLVAAALVLAGIFDWRLNLTALVAEAAALSLAFLVTSATPEPALGRRPLVPDDASNAPESVESPFIRFHTLRVMLRQYESSAAVRASIDRLVGEIADDRQRRALGFGTAMEEPRGASESLGRGRLEEAAMQSLTRTLDRLEQKD